MAESKKKKNDKNQKVENNATSKNTETVDNASFEGVVKEDMTQEEYIEFLECELGKNIALSQESENAAKRLRADFDNYKKRNASLSTECKHMGQELVLEAMLPLLDNCDRAKTMITDKSAIEGFELLEQQILEVFEKFEVKEIDAFGKEFDANYMNAVLSEENAEMKGKVLEVFTKGYMVGKKVLRYAIVKIAC